MIVATTEEKTVASPIRGRIEKWLTIIARILFGGVFIFSGFVKAADPWGTFYKLQDYLNVWHIDVPITIVLLGAFSLFTLEFLIGICVLLGVFRRAVAWIGAIFMGVMLSLTLWIALTDPVSDCGCFGDAILLSNWATFGKNMVLMALAVWLVMRNDTVQPAVRPAVQWLVFVTTVAYAVIIGLYGYVYQPLVDFRPYPVGSQIASASDEADDSITFIYEKDGRREEFDIENLPDESEGWNFVERKENKSVHQAGGLHIFDPAGDEEVTSEVLAPEGKKIILFFSDLRGVSIASSWLVNSLSTWAANNGLELVAVAAGAEDAIERWRDVSMADYPIYMAEDTSIKEVVRGNPAVVYLEDGIIKWKSSLRAIDADDFLAEGTSSDPMSFARNNSRILQWWTWLYVVIIGVLVAMSSVATLSMRRVFSKAKK